MGKYKNITALVAFCAMRKSEADYGSRRLVDENLIVLQRIHEMKMIKRKMIA